MPAKRQSSKRSAGTRAEPAAPSPLRGPEPLARTTLYFKPQSGLRLVDDPLHLDVSAIAIVGRTLFAACDETATVERLVLGADGDFHHEENIALGDYFDLPGDLDDEMDIEGLAIDGNDLWITSSHSLKRDKPDLPASDHAAALASLAEIEIDENRCFLGRLKLTDAGGGLFVVDAAAVAAADESSPACLEILGEGRNALKKHLENDPHLAAAMGMPCKENGFDIEGLAVKDGHVFLGLRGPVLRGWAVILELRPKAKKPGRLKSRKLNDAGDRYLKHFLPLEGLGIRDLRFDGEDLLILAGPTMDHDGTGALFRWRRPMGANDHRLHPADDLERLFDLPYDRGRNQAEGLAWLDTDQGRRLLVVHDSPSPERLIPDEQGLIADLFDLDG